MKSEKLKLDGGKSDLGKLRQEWIDRLKEIGSKLGFVCEEEVATNSGRVDLVWFYNFNLDLPGLGFKLPVVGFEVETSWRTRKHIKGDVFNLLELSPACGVILFLSRGFKDYSKLRGNVDATKNLLKASVGYAEYLFGQRRMSREYIAS